MSVSHILKSKGRDVITVAPNASVAAVAEILAKRRIGAVIVSTDGAKIQGIVSERDIVRCLSEKGAACLTLGVDSIMSRQVKTCTEQDTEIELMALMTDNRIRHLPVVADGKLAGMISIGDVVKSRIEAIEREAAEMKAYIAGAA
ncbi:MAG: CBS domain-containing protein [Aestuariivirga sp.]|jgi:CBS domain-containing protein